MGIVSKISKSRPLISFSQKLFLSVISLFLLSVVCFLVYQYRREKAYKIELLDLQLQDYNERIYLELHDRPAALWPDLLKAYKVHVGKELRITLISRSGQVLFDSQHPNEVAWPNHLRRPEVRQALERGKGYNVMRTSESDGTPYFYSATLYPAFIVRTALPYDVDLVRSLATDKGYLWFTLIVTLLLLLVFYRLTVSMGSAISHLREFAIRADRNDPIESDIQQAFPHNELGEISQHIIQIYRRLRETKEALYIEREKLITHLQSSREGLGVFNRSKREILVNNLFIQYSNQLSDSNLQTTEEIFAVAELCPVNDFIDKSLSQPLPTSTEEKRMSMTLTKNGRVFIIECIIFQDLSFEISINDITQEEEQRQLKRQLTQNIAHELKTPVSSIQGYLETIVGAEGRIPPEKLHTFLERCYAQSNRLSRLLRDISVLTRMDEASYLIDMERVDVGVLVNNIVGEVALELDEKHITVVNALKPHLLMQGNQSLLYSIFRNLMDNAIAYAGTHIRITIECFREDARFYYFSFADTGVGVPPEHLSRLFERFYRVDKGRSRKLGGTGLGLAIVKNAVLIHGGTILAKANPTGGLEFVFTLAKNL